MPAPTSILQRELKQQTPFESRYHEAYVAVLRTADVIRRRVGVVVEPHGITPQQYNVLRILRGAGAAGLPTLEIAERMVEQTPGITRMIDRLEAKALVARERGCDDRRQVLCRITEKGLELLAMLDAPLRDAHQVVRESLNESDIEALLGILDRIRSLPE
jgi:DNA-binding MarR family transcriptional regulator